MKHKPKHHKLKLQDFYNDPFLQTGLSHPLVGATATLTKGDGTKSEQSVICVFPNVIYTTAYNKLISRFERSIDSPPTGFNPHEGIVWHNRNGYRKAAKQTTYITDLKQSVTTSKKSA